MLPNDSEARRLLARERVDELAHEARRARGPAEYQAGGDSARRSLSGLRSLVSLLRGDAAHSAPAYRA